jgi:hypothetical protein
MTWIGRRKLLVEIPLDEIRSDIHEGKDCVVGGFWIDHRRDCLYVEVYDGTQPEHPWNTEPQVGYIAESVELFLKPTRQLSKEDV